MRAPLFSSSPGCHKRALPLSICAVAVMALSAYAQTPDAQIATPPPQTPPPADAAAATAPANSGDAAQAQKQPLEAGAQVQVVVLSLNDLSRVALDINHLQNAAQHLYDEVTIQPVSLETMPEMIGPGMIINIPVGTQKIGTPAPAKPERVNAAMAQIRSIATLMKQDVDAFMNGEKQLVVPGDAKKELTEDLSYWVAYVNNAYEQFTVLESLTQGPPYNQPAIANAASLIVQDGQQMEKLRRKIHKVLQRQGKRQEQLAKRQKAGS